MSVRLPSQKRFAPTRPKLGGRPGGPTVGGPPKAPSAGFVQPHPPAAVAGGSGSKDPALASAANENGEAGPSSRPDDAPGPSSGNQGTAPSTAQLLQLRRSMSPVKGPSVAPASKAGTAGNAGPSETPQSESPAQATIPGLSPTATTRILPSPSPRPSASPAPSSRPPLSIAQPRRAPSASPAPSARSRATPGPISRVSASPAPSARQRSMSRQPSLTPSMRMGGRPALIAAAENRSAPLNIPPSAKERRKAEKAREEAERESERGTPAPGLAHIPGMPPGLSAAPQDDDDVDMERAGSTAPSASGRRDRAATAAMAAQLVDQMRASATPAPAPPAKRSKTPNRSRTPLFLADVPEDRQESVPPNRAGTPDSGEDEEYDEETGQIIRQNGVAVDPTKKKKAKRAPAKPRAPKGSVAPQRKRHKKASAAKARGQVEDEDDDANLNELDISDDDDLARSSQAGSTVGVKRKRKVARSPVFQPVNLDEAEVGELIGEEVDEDNMRMSEIATKRSGEGKVSARAKELSVYLRDYTQRNKSRLQDESNERYERRQILRRQIRALRNAKREERRVYIREHGGDAEAEVTEDEPDSETEFEVRPERLTPEATPEPGGRSMAVDDDGVEIEEEEYVEPPEGRRLALEDDEDEDAEPPEEEPEEEIFDPTLHLQDERHEDEENGFDPELAALGFAPGPATYENEEFDENSGETMEDWLEQLEQNKRNAQRRNDTREVIEEEQTGKMPNSRSYAKKTNNERWSAEETEFFYQVLGETGENYTLMSFYFPSRTPRQLKNKGKKENMADPDRVNEAIRARRPIDPEYLQKTVGYDPRGPTDDADQLLEETRDLPARWTREDTDRVMKDIAEEDEDGNRVEEVEYDPTAVVAAGVGEDGKEDEEVEEEDGEKGDEEEEEEEEDMVEEEEDQGGYDE